MPRPHANPISTALDDLAVGTNISMHADNAITTSSTVEDCWRFYNAIECSAVKKYDAFATCIELAN